MGVIFLLFGLGCVFFIVGHSLLLHFKTKDSAEVPLSDALLPWPKNGRFVSLLCFSLSFLMLSSLPWFFPVRSGASAGAWKILFIFIIFPVGSYAYFFARRIRRTSEGLVFVSPRPGDNDWKIPLIIVIAVNASYYILK